MNNERLGLAAIFASILVFAATGWLVLRQEAQDKSALVRAHGRSVVRLLTGLAPDELARADQPRGAFQQILRSQGHVGELAYAILLDQGGKVVAEFVAPEAAPPAQTVPHEHGPHSGDQLVPNPGGGRTVREFFAPVLNAGASIGFLRVAFFEPALTLSHDSGQYLALLALPSFLLAGGLYALVRTETRPLAELSKALDALSGPGDGTLARRLDLRDFVTRLRGYLQATETRMRELETQQSEELATGKLIAYRKERLESALRTLPDGVLVVDENAVATYANDKAGPLIGVPAAELLDRSIHDLSLPAEVAASLARAQGRPGSGSHVTHYFPPDDPQRRISFSSHALFAPRDPARRLGTLIVARDTSEALLAARARDEFIAHVAHELKTPLANVAMYSELLLEPDAMSPDQRIEAVNVVHDEAERMATLIDNLLSISRIEAGTFSLAQARVRMHDLLDDCFEKARHNTRARSMKLVLDIPSEIGATDADKDLLRIAVDNLLTNAIKYNRPDGEVILSAREIDDRIEIRVRDTGLGIPHADQPRVFEKFFRSADREAVARGGHGLGLYLVRQIVDLHHGNVSVESEPGKGTEFTLTLRRSAALLKEAA